MRQRTSIGWIIVGILAGALAGSIVGEVLGNNFPILQEHIAFGIQTTYINLNVISFPFGLQMKLNLGSALGVLIALFLGMRRG